MHVRITRLKCNFAAKKRLEAAAPLDDEEKYNFYWVKWPSFRRLGKYGGFSRHHGMLLTLHSRWLEF
jgi:hypothetical protein